MHCKDHVWGLTSAQCRKVKEVGDREAGDRSPGERRP